MTNEIKIAGNTVTWNNRVSVPMPNQFTVPEDIRLHGLLTDVLAGIRHKQDALAVMRAGLNVEPGLEDEILGDSARDYQRMLDKVSRRLGYG